MMSLFSSFDSFTFNLEIFVAFISASCMLIYFSSKFSLYKNLISNFYKFLTEFFISLNDSNMSKNLENFLLSLMFLIFFFNLSSIFSYNFAIGSQVSVILFVSLSFWVSLTIFSMTKNFKGQFSHFMPEGAPLSLSIFLVLIEMASGSIRPLTLMVRLVANILAGHLLVILLSIFIQEFAPFFLCLSFLNAVESFVSLIQSYILATLLTLYFSEM